MRRKRRAVAPNYRTPVPYNPLTGAYRPLRRPGAVAQHMVARVVEISDDYLTCEGWDPYSHTYVSDVIVAKPFLLRANPGGAIRYPSGETEAASARLNVHPAWFVGDLLVAVRMEVMDGVGEAVSEPVLEGSNWSKPTELYLPDDMPMEGMTSGEGEEEKPVFWMDMNVAGRHWDTLHGMTIRAYETVIADTNDEYVRVKFDNVVSSFGDGLELVNNGIKNVSGIALVGDMGFSVTAQRQFGDGEETPPDDVDSILQVIPNNNLNDITGIPGRLSSSRRRPPELARCAVNSVSGRPIQSLAAGEILTVFVMKKFGVYDNDNWETVENQCHLTFTTYPGVTLN